MDFTVNPVQKYIEYLFLDYPPGHAVCDYLKKCKQSLIGSSIFLFLGLCQILPFLPSKYKSVTLWEA